MRQNELYHYGVPGMKWGVRKAITTAVKGFNKIQQHGSNTLNKKAARYQARSDRHLAKGHNIRAKRNLRKSEKYQDKSFDDIESFYSGIKDISTKALAAYNVTKVGASFVGNVLKDYAENKNTKLANKEILDYHNKHGLYSSKF